MRLSRFSPWTKSAEAVAWSSFGQVDRAASGRGSGAIVANGPRNRMRAWILLRLQPAQVLAVNGVWGRRPYTHPPVAADVYISADIEADWALMQGESVRRHQKDSAPNPRCRAIQKYAESRSWGRGAALLA